MVLSQNKQLNGLFCAFFCVELSQNTPPPVICTLQNRLFEMQLSPINRCAFPICLPLPSRLLHEADTLTSSWDDNALSEFSYRVFLSNKPPSPVRATSPPHSFVVTYLRAGFGMPSVILRSCPLLRKEWKRTKKESKKNGKRTQLRMDGGGASGADAAFPFVSWWLARWPKGVGSFRLATEVEWAKREPNGRF